jgi:hypothetical protein
MDSAPAQVVVQDVTQYLGNEGVNLLSRTGSSSKVNIGKNDGKLKDSQHNANRNGDRNGGGDEATAGISRQVEEGKGESLSIAIRDLISVKQQLLADQSLLQGEQVWWWPRQEVDEVEREVEQQQLLMNNWRVDKPIPHDNGIRRWDVHNNDEDKYNDYDIGNGNLVHTCNNGDDDDNVVKVVEGPSSTPSDPTMQQQFISYNPLPFDGKDKISNNANDFRRDRYFLNDHIDRRQHELHFHTWRQNYDREQEETRRQNQVNGDDDGDDGVVKGNERPLSQSFVV